MYAKLWNWIKLSVKLSFVPLYYQQDTQQKLYFPVNFYIITLGAFFAIVIKYHRKTTEGKKIYLAHNSKFQSITAEIQGIKNLKQQAMPHPKWRAENNELTSAFWYLHCFLRSHTTQLTLPRE